jgi:2-amino-4-hydroxy-6-hydroxymethyldihydropteridine diphosphokinase
MSFQNIFLSLGSNLGDRLSNLSLCVNLIGTELGPVINLSTIYETEPWGKSNQPNYLNQAIQIETYLEPSELLSACQHIEREMGRQRDEKWGARLIDIDIIYFGDKILTSDRLIVPHPRIAERKFVLAPLNEISPAFLHPIHQKSNQELLSKCKDVLAVKFFQP